MASLKELVEDFAKNEHFEPIDALPSSYGHIRDLLRAAQGEDEKLIQPLYTKVNNSSDTEISALTQHPYVLLNALLTITITHGSIPMISRLLAINPSPKPDLRRFLSQPGTLFSTRITAAQNPELRALMLKHGYQKSDRHGVAFDQGLYNAILGESEDCMDTISTMLENGAQPKMAHLRAAMKFQSISVFELLAKHYPVQELEDCRLLHDAVAEGKAGRVTYLLDVARVNIDMFATERPEEESQFPNPHGPSTTIEPNGTPLHEAVRHGRRGILELLLERGARIDIRDEHGRTPYDVATKRKRKDIMACFPKYEKATTTILSRLLSSFGGEKTEAE